MKPWYPTDRCHDLEMRRLRVEWSGTEEILGHLESEIESIAPLLRAQAADGGRPFVCG